MRCAQRLNVEDGFSKVLLLYSKYAAVLIEKLFTFLKKNAKIIPEDKSYSGGTCYEH